MHFLRRRDSKILPLLQPHSPIILWQLLISISLWSIQSLEPGIRSKIFSSYIYSYISIFGFLLLSENMPSYLDYLYPIFIDFVVGKLKYQIEGGSSHLPLVNPAKRATPLTPSEWRQRLQEANSDNPDKNYLLLDVRNGTLSQKSLMNL